MSFLSRLLGLDELVEVKLSSIHRKLDHNQELLMAKLEDVLADVTAETTQIEGLSKLISGLKVQLADALSGTTLPPDVQAKVDAIFAAAEANKAAAPTEDTTMGREDFLTKRLAERGEELERLKTLARKNLGTMCETARRLTRYGKSTFELDAAIEQTRETLGDH